MADILDRLKVALADRYRIERELGAGGMATVYLAHDIRHERPVAVKVLRPELAAALGSERFLREIKIAANLNHPHILPLHDSGEADGFLYYVMPYVEGENLRQHIDRGRLATGGGLPLEDALRIASEVAGALDYAHRRNIVHRDVKPENILLAEGHPVVADFGIARAISAAGGQTLTQAGLPIGTPRYMSPEQAMGVPNIDARADIYSLALVLYEMIAGELPRTPSEVRSVSAGRLGDTPPEHRKRLEKLPQAAAEVLGKALTENPEGRLETAEHFAAALLAPVGQMDAGPGVIRKWNRLLIAGLVTVVVAMAVIVGLLVSGSGAGITSNRVLVATFENQTGDVSLAALGHMTADWLTRGLQEMGPIEVVDARTVASESEATSSAVQPGTASTLELARSVGAGTLVSGAFYRDADSIRIVSQVTEVGTGTLLYSLDPVAGSVASPLDAVETLRQRVTGAIATIFDQAWSVQSFRPPRYDAYREYMAAAPLIGRLNTEGAVSRLRTAWARDSNFTLAPLYASTLFAEAGLYHQAESLAVMVGRRRERLRVSEAAMLEYLRARLRGDFATALGAIRPVAEGAPFAEPAWGFALTLMRLNRPREASELYARLDPRRGFLQEWWFYWNIFGAAYHMMGEHETELEIAKRGQAHYPDHMGVVAAEAHALAALGRVDDVFRLLDEMRGMPQDWRGPLPPMLYLTSVAGDLRAHGNLEAAIAVLDRVRSWAETRSASQLSSPLVRAHMAHVAYSSERWDEAQEQFSALAEEFPSDVNYQGYLGVLAARRADRQQAGRISRWLESLERPFLFGINALWRARIAALLGDQQQAMTLLRAALEQGLPFYGNAPSLWISRTDAHWLHRDMDFESMREYPPFAELMRPKG
jgi:tRNA A-37 threonylcarbamoyl transferase component Bud32/tetratricopeptide (TPR) repeat protein/TolB-like protein